MKKTILIVLFSILTAFFGFFAVAGQITVDVTRTREITVGVVEDDTSVDEDNTATEGEEQGEEQGTEQNTEGGEEQGTEQGTEGGEEQGTEQNTEQGTEQNGEEQGGAVAASYKLVSAEVTEDDPATEDGPVAEEVTTETYTTPFNEVLYGWSDALVNHKEVVNITCAFLFAICAVLLEFVIFHKFTPSAKKETAVEAKAGKTKKVAKEDKKGKKSKGKANEAVSAETSNRPPRPRIKF